MSCHEEGRSGASPVSPHTSGSVAPVTERRRGPRRAHSGLAYVLRLIVAASCLAASWSYAAKVTEYETYGNGWLGGKGSGWQSTPGAACARMVGAYSDRGIAIITYVSSVPDSYWLRCNVR